MSDGGLTTGEGPLTLGRSPGPLFQSPCPTQEALLWRQRGDLASLQLECWVCACSWRPCTGQARPGLSPSCSLLGARCGGDMGVPRGFSTSRTPSCL